MNWIEWFFTLAETVSLKSKDNHTKVGAVLVGDKNNILSVGFNGLPIGVQDLNERLERPEKYKWISHAEANAISLAARHGIKLEGSKLYCTKFPCSDCAKLIIQAGIKEIYTKKHDNDLRWIESSQISLKMFEEADIKVNEYD